MGSFGSSHMRILTPPSSHIAWAYLIFVVASAGNRRYSTLWTSALWGTMPFGRKTVTVEECHVVVVAWGFLYGNEVFCVYIILAFTIANYSVDGFGYTGHGQMNQYVTVMILFYGALYKQSLLLFLALFRAEGYRMLFLFELVLKNYPKHPCIYYYICACAADSFAHSQCLLSADCAPGLGCRLCSLRGHHHLWRQTRNSRRDGWCWWSLHSNPISLLSLMCAFSSFQILSFLPH